MPAKVTIYNDSPSARDLEATVISSHPKAPMITKRIQAEGEGGDCHLFELEPHDVLIIRRVE